MINECKELFRRIGDSKYAPILQFIKFGIVGVSNTLISYGIEMVCYYFLFANVPWLDNIKIIITSILAFTISVTNSYYWNNKYVFATGSPKKLKDHLKTFVKTVLCYGSTGLLLAPAIKIYLNHMGLPYWIASLLSFIVTIPLNFILNKLWAFQNKTGRDDSIL